MNVSVADMQKLIAGELSLRSRVAYTALLLVALGVAVVVGSLLLTEPSLPQRTEVAFAVIIAIALSWVAYASWVLTRRQVLFAGHRIVAGRMAVAFSALFVAGCLAVRMMAAAGLGALMLAIAIGILITARQRFRALMERRRALEAM